MGSISIWMLQTFILTDAVDGGWRFVVLDCFALIYFCTRWSSQEAQHRQFHFLLMWSYMATTVFYAYQFWFSSFANDAIGMSSWWHQLLSNILFGCELLLISIYALLYRRAKRNKAQYLSDVDTWLKKAGDIKEAIKGTKPNGPRGKRR